MQMKTRSTTRAEAAAMQVTTRARVQPAEVPCFLKTDEDGPGLVGYKLPRWKARLPNAHLIAGEAVIGGKRNLALHAINHSLAEDKTNEHELVPTKRLWSTCEDL